MSEHAEMNATSRVAIAGQSRPPAKEIVHEIDDLDVAEFTDVAATFGQDRYGFVVTPNVDHLIRYHEDAGFRALYNSADFVLLDSRFAALLLRTLRGIHLRVCTGADLTVVLLSQVIAPEDRVVLVGGTEEQAQTLIERFGLKNARHHNPPMGFIKDPGAVDRCVRFIESVSPFRFCFLALGSPQQELVAQYLMQRGTARGFTLCVGAALNFVTGTEVRAPRWMQRMALEWLYRLLQDPRRLARRYLVRGPRIFKHLRKARFVLRAHPTLTSKAPLRELLDDSPAP
jgi:exopolysaccharide biosynthesis WecB/TagA/CpsF family protein